MKFKIINIHCGWLDGYIKKDKECLEFSYSDCTDFFGDFLKEILGVIKGDKLYGIIHTELEPGDDTWILYYKENNICIDIYDEDFYSDCEFKEIIIGKQENKIKIHPYIKKYSFEITKKEFMNVIINEIENNLEKYYNNYLCCEGNSMFDINYGYLEDYISEIRKMLNK